MPRRMPSLALCSLILVAASTGACFDRALVPLEPCLTSTVQVTERLKLVEAIDLVFLVDNSGSMKEEQAALAREFPELVRVLVSGDLDGDGGRDFTPVRSLRVAVISSDMGHGGFPFDPEAGTGVADSHCNAEFGDDGLFHESAECRAGSTTYLEFTSDGNESPEEFGRDFGCLASLGTSGCGFEMQLEAMLKALTPSDADVTFYGDTRGHGGPNGLHAGFVRDDSLLAIVLVTDEDDCATFDYSIFTHERTATPNLTCLENKPSLLPIERYVSGLLRLREDPQSLVFAAIVGVETDLVDAVGKACERDTDCGVGSRCGDGRCLQDCDAILDHPSMEETADGAYLRPSCRRPHFNDGKACTPATARKDCEAVSAACIDGACRATQDAYPPRRIVEVARGIEAAGSNGIVTSICQDDFRPALGAIIRKLAGALGTSCLPRKLHRNGADLVPCEVLETLPSSEELASAAEACAGVPGREVASPDPATGLPRCRVLQVADAEAGSGWYYDDSSADLETTCQEGKRQRIVFTEDARPRARAKIAVECKQPVLSQEITLGTPCEVANDVCASGESTRKPKYGNMFCEPTSNTCQMRCEADVDCRAQGLGPHVCDLREGKPRICVNPTCQF